MPRPANLPCQLFRQWKGRWQGQVPPPFPVLEAHALVPSTTQGVGVTLLEEIRPAGTHHRLGHCCGGVALWQGTCVLLISWKDCRQKELGVAGGGKGRTANLFLYSFCLVFYPARRVFVSLLVCGGEAKEAFPGGGCPVGPSCPQVVLQLIELGSVSFHLTNALGWFAEVDCASLCP